MWIKLLGICLVCVSCAGIGGGEALRLIGRRRFLEEVKRIAAGLQGEIGYTQAVLPLALCRAGARGDGKAGKLFFVAGARHCAMSAIVAAHRLSAPPVFYYTDYYSRNYRYKHRTYNYCSYMCHNPRKHTTDSSLLILAAGIILRRRAVKF